jgi:hypothetical protein
MIGSFLLALALSPAASADDVSVAARVDTDHVALNEQILLEVTVTGDRTDLPEPAMPSLPNFQVYSSGRSQNVTISGGKVQSTIVYSYVLVPRFVGDAVIPPITVEAGGKTYASTSIAINVGKPSQGGTPSGPPPSTPRANPTARRPRPSGGGNGAPDLFVTSKVDRPKAYVGQQVTLSVRFHTAVELLGNPEYVPPATQGFLSEDLPPLRNSQLTDRGRIYYYTEIKTALFPLEPGSSPIAPAVVRAQVRQDAAVDPFAPDFFQKFFSQGLLAGQTRELKTEPIAVQVLPLPEDGKPSEFTGAVGRYRAKAAVSKTNAQVGDAVDLIVTVEGEGNLRTAGDLKLPQMDSFQVYDTVTSLSLAKKNDVVTSVKTYKTVLVPKASGAVRVPGIPFSYFDPSAQKYVQLETEPIDVQVAPGAARPSASIGTTAPAPGVVAVASDIRYLKESAGAAWVSALTGLTTRRLPHALPLAALVLCVGLSAMREQEARDPRGQRARKALLRAKESIHASERARKGGRHDQAATLLAEAVQHYLYDKLGPDAAGMPFHKALELMHRRHPKIGEERLSSLRGLWDELEGRRFAPRSANQKTEQALADAAMGHLEALDRELRS